MNKVTLFFSFLLIGISLQQSCDSIKPKDKFDCLQFRIKNGICCYNKNKQSCTERSASYSGFDDDLYDCSIPITPCGPKFGSTAKDCATGNKDVKGGLCCIDFQGSCMSVPFNYKKDSKFTCYEEQTLFRKYKWYIVTFLAILLIISEINDRKKAAAEKKREEEEEKNKKKN
jgi:hypothetical protein